MKYPDGETAAVEFNSRGLPKALWVAGELIVSGVDYDERGALSQLRYVKPNIWRQQTYHWGTSAGNGNGQLAEIRVGTTTLGATDIMKLSYTYDNFGNISYIDENYLDGGNVSNEFRSEAHNRILWDTVGGISGIPMAVSIASKLRSTAMTTSAGANIYAVKTVAGGVALQLQRQWQHDGSDISARTMGEA